MFRYEAKSPDHCLEHGRANDAGGMVAWPQSAALAGGAGADCNDGGQWHVESGDCRGSEGDC